MAERTASAPVTAARILIVDDEINIVELLSMSLKFQGFEVYSANNGAAALDQAQSVKPDAVILDLTMPGMDGFGVLRRLRSAGIEAPVVFLTARDALQDRVFGLTIGADDYITKPFSLEEVVTRLRVILKRFGIGVTAAANHRLSYADIELDQNSHEVWKAGEPVSLSPKEFALLRHFMVKPGKVLSKQDIFENLWHHDFGGEIASVASYISFLRRKIDNGPQQLLHTLRGVGYVLREQSNCDVT